MAELEVRSISKTFGNKSVLHDVSLRVPDGGFTILLGPSGCGKSTLLRIIAGLDQQTGGQILMGGTPVDHLSPKDRDIAMVFQSYALYPHLTVRDNMAFGLRMRGEARQVIKDRIEEAAQLLDIGGLLDRKPRELSGGQRQRVAMGRAIVRKPKLFLFDEPLSNLDARLREIMRVELKKLQQRLGITMVYVTHDQVEAMTLGTLIVVMDRGRIRQIGPPSRIYGEPADPFVAGFVGTPEMNLWEGRIERHGEGWTFQSGLLTLPVPRVKGQLRPEQGTRVVLGIRPEDILLEQPAAPAARVSGLVEVAEDLGSERILHLLAGDRRVVMCLRQGGRVEPGSTVAVHLPHDRLHLFVDDRRVDWDRPGSA